MGATVLAAAYDRLYTENNHRRLERVVVALSVLGFLTHLLLVFLARRWSDAPPWITAAGHNYLSAIATPFNFVLFYEVLILIAAIPQSTTQSIATQFEIVSLIFVRGFFQDIAGIDLDELRKPSTDLFPALLDVAAGITMFLLVSIFRHATRRREAAAPGELPPALRRFIDRKKMVSFAITILFFGLAAHSIWEFAADLEHGPGAAFHTQSGFYADVFMAMIFTDVLILLLSLLVSDHYELVFRNAAFVISTILIRSALTAGHPYGAAVGVAGMIFGILTVLIYNYNLRVIARK